MAKSCKARLMLVRGIATSGEVNSPKFRYPEVVLAFAEPHPVLIHLIVLFANHERAMNQTNGIVLYVLETSLKFITSAGLSGGQCGHGLHPNMRHIKHTTSPFSSLILVPGAIPKTPPSHFRLHGKKKKTSLITTFFTNINRTSHEAFSSRSVHLRKKPPTKNLDQGIISQLLPLNPIPNTPFSTRCLRVCVVLGPFCDLPPLEQIPDKHRGLPTDPSFRG